MESQNLKTKNIQIKLRLAHDFLRRVCFFFPLYIFKRLTKKLTQNMNAHTRTLGLIYISLLTASCQPSGGVSGGYGGGSSGTPLIVSAPSDQVVMGGTLQFTSTGGSTSHTFSVASGAGSIDSTTGLFTAASSIGTVLIKVEDSSGNQNYSQINVVWTGISSIDSIAGDGLRLNWPAVTGALIFKIFNVTTGTPVFMTTVLGAITDYTISGLTPSTLYTYRVQVVTPDGIDQNTNDQSGTTQSITAAHSGWEHVKALGGRTPVPQATGLSATSASVYLKWKAMTLNSSSITSYNIYRATSPGGQDFNTPLSTGITLAAREYIDNTVVAGTTYYYVVNPMVGVSEVSTFQSDSEIKVIVPPANMVLVHRWIVNQEMCGLMLAPIDRDNNYRCDYTGLGGDGTYYDMGYSYFVDVVELGCNYTDGNMCGSSVCLGAGSPDGGVTAAINTVFYDRQNGICWINVDGAADWKENRDGSLLPSQRSILASNNPGLPPLTTTNQAQFGANCDSYSEAGFIGNKRLLSRKESIAASGWDASLTDLQIASLEFDPTTLATANQCNTNSASGLVFDELAVPGDHETVPWLLSTSRESLRTGSNSTSNCVSRYGAQDMIGNVWEWNSDQVIDGLGVVSSVDGTNDWDGWNATGYSNNSFFNIGSDFLPALGIPWPSSASGTIPNSSWDNIHSDKISIVTTGSRGALFGGYWNFNSGAGRFGLSLSDTITYASGVVGGRCSLPADL